MSGKNKYIGLFRTIFVTGLAFVVNYGINLVLTPYITNNVSTEAYGFVSLAKQFAQYAIIITTVLNSFAARYITIEYHKGNKKDANMYFSSVFFGDLALGSVIFIIAVIGTLFLEKLLNIPEQIVTDVKFLFLLVFVNFWIVTVFTVFGSAAFIKNKLDLTGIFKGTSYITEALVLYVLYLLLPANVFYVGIGLIMAALVVALSNIWINQRYTSDLKIDKKNFSIQAVKRLVLAGLWTSVTMLGNLLNNGLDLIVCNLMLTSLAMGHLAIAKSIDTMFQSLYQLVGQAFQPIFLKSYAENDKHKLLQELKLSMKLSGLLSNVSFAGFIALGLVYYRLWIPNQDTELLYHLTIITILTSVPCGPMNPLYYIYTLTVKRVVPCFVTLTGGFLNVVGMYFLIKYTSLDVYAVVWTTAVVMFVINLISNPLYMAHVLKVPWHTFYPNIIRNLLACVIVVMAFKGLTLLYMPDSWITLVVCILIYAVIGAGLHLAIVCESAEWNDIKRLVNRRGVQND